MHRHPHRQREQPAGVQGRNGPEAQSRVQNKTGSSRGRAQSEAGRGPRPQRLSPARANGPGTPGRPQDRRAGGAGPARSLRDRRGQDEPTGAGTGHLSGTRKDGCGGGWIPRGSGDSCLGPSGVVAHPCSALGTPQAPGRAAGGCWLRAVTQSQARALRQARGAGKQRIRLPRPRGSRAWAHRACGRHTCQPHGHVAPAKVAPGAAQAPTPCLRAEAPRTRGSPHCEGPRGNQTSAASSFLDRVSQLSDSPAVRQLGGDVGSCRCTRGNMNLVARGRAVAGVASPKTAPWTGPAQHGPLTCADAGLGRPGDPE